MVCITKAAGDISRVSFLLKSLESNVKALHTDILFDLMGTCFSNHNPRTHSGTCRKPQVLSFTGKLK